MNNFRTLELAIEFYKKCEGTKVSGHLRDQLIRAASSISLNLAEGNAKKSVKEKRRYFLTAYGSLKECQTIFRLADLDDEIIVQMANHLGASLYKLMNSKISAMPSVF
jgi:four helix bundle protein